LNYQLHNEKHGIYLFVIDGELEVGEDALKSRDGIGIYDVSEISVKSKKATKFLVMEIPMN